MAELALKEYLQPSLLDRLTDDTPNTRFEALTDEDLKKNLQMQQRNREFQKRVMTEKEFRMRVKRDLAWLLNTSSLESAQNLDNYPNVKTSVVNYGVCNAVGTMLSSIDVSQLRQQLQHAIVAFEPRIAKKSLSIKVAKAEDNLNHNALQIEIQGDIWGQTLPFYLKTLLDLETGHLKITDN
jgi:type VI secretion system protein ImpF